MYINIYILFAILVLHFIGDFIVQGIIPGIAEAKSYSIKALLIHSITYMGLFILISPMYMLVNGVLHCMVDFITSKFTRHFRRNNNIPAFFMVIGFDQLMHTIILVLTYVILFGGVK